MTMWYEIPDFPGYRMNHLAEVMSLLGEEPQIKQAHICKKSGYWRITLRQDGKDVNCQLHQLVARVFLGPCPPGLQVCHNDNDRLNVSISNLRYDTPKGNVADSIRAGTHHSVTEANRTQCDRGHDYTPENTYYRSSQRGDGKVYRKCKQCQKDATKRYRERRKKGLTPTVGPPPDRIQPRTEAEWDAYLAREASAVPATE